MRVTVLGKSPSWQDAGGACSGYLVAAEGHTLLLDCGSGVFSALRGVMDYRAVDAVLISHLHADHFFDLVPFSYALRHGPREPSRIRLFAPPGARTVFRTVVGAYSADTTLVESSFELVEYTPAEPRTVGPFRLRLCEVPHYTPTWAVELVAGGRRFTFGADCGPNDPLVEFARDTDLLLVEATLVDADPDEEDRGHLTGREAGATGRRADARRLVLTHYSDELDATRLCETATEAFGAPVELARAGDVYEV